MHRCYFMVYRTDIKNTEIYAYNEATRKVRYVLGPDVIDYAPIHGAVCLAFGISCHFDYIILHKKHTTPIGIKIGSLCSE